jgi:hypothetical protein
MLKELLSYGQNWTLQAVEKGGENLYLMILAFSDLEFEVKGILGGGAREDVLLDIGRARRSQQAGPAGESIQRAEQTLRFFSFFFFFLAVAREEASLYSDCASVALGSTWGRGCLGIGLL